MHVLLIIAMLVSGLGGTAATVAAQDSLPGEALYGLKTATEQVKLAAAFSEESKAVVHLQIAATRAEEMGKALDKNDVRGSEEAAKGLGDVLGKAKGKSKEAGASSTTPDGKPGSTTTTPAASAGSTSVTPSSLCDDLPGHSERGILAKLRAREAAAGRGQQHVVDNLKRAIENQLRHHGLDFDDAAAIADCAETGVTSSSSPAPAASSTQTPSSSAGQGQSNQGGQGGQNPATGSSQADDGHGKGKGQGGGGPNSATGPGNSQGRGNR